MATITLKTRTDNTIYLDCSFIKPGDTVILPSCLWAKLWNVNGVTGNEINFVTSDVTIIGGFASYVLQIIGHDFKINGEGKLRLGKKDANGYVGAFGLALGNSSRVECSGIEFTEVAAGIMQNPHDGAPIVNNYFHDLHFHDLSNPKDLGRSECMYMGWTGGISTALFQNCRIENIIIENVSGDGLQCGNGEFHLKNITVINHGLAKLKDQRNGISFGGNSTGTLHKAVITGGYGTGLMLLGNSVEVRNVKISHIDLRALSEAEDIIYNRSAAVMKNVTIENCAGRYGINSSGNSGSKFSQVLMKNNIFDKDRNLQLLDSWTDYIVPTI